MSITNLHKGSIRFLFNKSPVRAINFKGTPAFLKSDVEKVLFTHIASNHRIVFLKDILSIAQHLADWIKFEVTPAIRACGFTNERVLLVQMSLNQLTKQHINAGYLLETARDLAARKTDLQFGTHIYRGNHGNTIQAQINGSRSV